MCPSTRIRSPPKLLIWERIVAGEVAGAYTRPGTPARAAYAARATPAFPAVGTTNDLASARTARVTAAARPRALKEPVGLVLSSFTHNRERPCLAASRGAGKRGVPPPPSVTRRSSARSGRPSREAPQSGNHFGGPPVGPAAGGGPRLGRGGGRGAMPQGVGRPAAPPPRQSAGI